MRGKAWVLVIGISNNNTVAVSEEENRLSYESEVWTIQLQKVMMSKIVFTDWKRFD